MAEHRPLLSTTAAAKALGVGKRVFLRTAEIQGLQPVNTGKRHLWRSVEVQRIAMGDPAIRESA